MKNVISLLLTCFISLIATSGHAATVNGSLTVGGVYDNTPSNTITLTSVWTSGGATGDFIGTVFGSPVGTGGAMASLDSFSTVNSFFVVEGWTLDLTSLVVDVPNTFLNLSGEGVLIGHGFDATEAIWSFSAESSTSYSMTVTVAGIPAVPVPAAIWLFGSGLIGLVGVARRKV
jgi:hypothetical protein